MSDGRKRRTRRVSPTGPKSKKAAPKAIYVFDDAGEITQTIGPATTEMIAAYESYGFQFIVSDEQRDDLHSNFYVDGGELRRKQTMTVSVSKAEIIANNEDVSEIVGVPAGATIAVSVFGQVAERIADGSPIPVISDMPATYRIRITAPRMLAFETEIVSR